MCLVTFSWKESDSLEKVKTYRGRPTWANIELTEFCNFDCKWCYAAANISFKKKRIHMSKKNAVRLLKILAESGIKEITCSGGEPLMYPHIHEFIKEARNYGMIVHMNTNGYFLTKTLAKKLHDAGLTQIQTNIDSLDPAKHDAIRGKSGSLKHSLKALKNAIDVGMTAVSETVVTKQGENEIFDIIKFAREKIGVHKCRVWDATPSGAVLENMEMIPKNYPDILRRVVKLVSKMGATEVLSYEPFFPEDVNASLKVTQTGCPVSMGMLVHVLPNGDVPYCVTVRSQIMYNIFDYKKIGKIHPQMIRKYNESILGSDNGCASRMIINNSKDYQKPH